MYAIKIRRSDLPLLTVLNGGVTPKVETKTTYLIVDPSGSNQIVTEKTLKALKLSSTGPKLHKLRK